MTRTLGTETIKALKSLWSTTKVAYITPDGLWASNDVAAVRLTTIGIPEEVCILHLSEGCSTEELRRWLVIPNRIKEIQRMDPRMLHDLVERYILDVEPTTYRATPVLKEVCVGKTRTPQLYRAYVPVGIDSNTPWDTEWAVYVHDRIVRDVCGLELDLVGAECEPKVLANAGSTSFDDVWFLITLLKQSRAAPRTVRVPYNPERIRRK